MTERQIDAEPIRVLIADDQRLFAEGLKTILESRAPDIEIVGIAVNGQEAVEMTGALSPAIVLLDIRMPVMDGVEASRQIHLSFPTVRIVVLTTFDDDDYVKHSLAYGAIGYLLKNRPPAELIASIRAVQGGILQIDPGVAKTLIHDMQEKGFNDKQFSRNLNLLTSREREVITLLIEAFDNRQISTRLNIAEQTVRNYISAIYTKLGIENRLEIVKYTDSIRFFLEYF